jgi:dihydrolipoamide dehydrogenase
VSDVDAIVIGSGQGGVPFAVESARRGRRVVLFERGAIGGTCVNVGCTPSKAFLAAAHAAGRARKASALGLRGTFTLDYPAVMERVRGIVASFRSGAEKRLAEAGVELIRAEASFEGERAVGAGGVSMSAPLVVIDTGASAMVPDIPGLAGTPYLTNETFFDQRVLPKRFIVLGGGYVGLELGQGMARAGSEVHVIHRASRLLNGEEPDASDLLQQALLDDGARIHLNATTRSVRYDGGVFNLELDDGTSVAGEALLVATGRRPNTSALNVNASGLALDKCGFVAIDDRFATACPGVYAIGEVAGQPAFTHVSWEDHRRLLAILAGEPRTRNDRVLAYSTFTEPQVARVGDTLDQALAKGIKARAVTLRLDSVARAIEWGEKRGFYRMVVDSETDKIIGATLVGYETAELIHVFVAHIQAGSTWQTLDRSVHIHPTYAEGLPSLARLLNEPNASA